ncbi:MAG: radical SAM protein [Planctomycetota bacterium]|nr:radical SAM protein [Planctomycetota bacterium]
MARILLLHPSRWGRGITAIWIASHAAVLKGRGHEVDLFDATFYRDWAEDEVAYNTLNQQYQPTDYDRRITWKTEGVREALQARLDAFRPDVVFWSAISSHIHGEGEYVSIQYGCELMADCRSDALLVCGGLQPTAAPADSFRRFPALDLLISGESEMPLGDIADALSAGRPLEGIPGVHRRLADGSLASGPRQPIISDLDAIGPYDYSLFEDQLFLRPYNGHVVRAVDYELSRGCAFTCTYCVETVIQQYYGFTKFNRRGALVDARKYLRNKSARRVFDELSWLYHERRVTLVRCQDTNFLTIDNRMLRELADLLDTMPLPIQLYIETRPEGITATSAALLKRLQVDGVGMGIELSTQAFREERLNRFADQGRITKAFRLLRTAGIRRTAYNIIGLAGQDEASILETIEFNRLLDPDNVTVAFYSPFLGTQQQVASAAEHYFADYEYRVDPQLRTMSRHDVVTPELLDFYKGHITTLVRNGTANLAVLKRAAGIGGSP